MCCSPIGASRAVEVCSAVVGPVCRDRPIPIDPGDLSDIGHLVAGVEVLVASGADRGGHDTPDDGSVGPVVEMITVQDPALGP